MKPVFLTAAMLALALSGPLAAEQLNHFDVAEDITRFSFAPQPVFEDGMPAYGNACVTPGYIYPAGTLDGGVEGTLADGTPAFPEKVLGTWTCDGFFVGEGMRTTEGDLLISRQVFQFQDGGILITQGTEGIDENVWLTRAVTGGTGDYADAPAEIRQKLLGMSDGYGVRLQFELGDARQAALEPLRD